MMIIIITAVPRLLVTDEDPAILINMQNKARKQNKHIMRSY